MNQMRLTVPSVIILLALSAGAFKAPPAKAQNAWLSTCMETLGYDGCNALVHPQAPAPPPEPDVWGAIAASPSTLMSGTSWNYSSEQAAISRAMKECQAQGVQDCKIIASFADICASLAISKPERIEVVGGPISAANYADNNAMLKCTRAGGRSCTLITSFCADGLKHTTKSASGDFKS